jgi:methyltransferase-like protein 6
LDRYNIRIHEMNTFQLYVIVDCCELYPDDVWDDERETEAKERIKLQGEGLGTFWKDQYDKKAFRYWHEFYKRNKTNFYKDRHYLHVVFPELAPDYPRCDTTSTVRMLEVGCGVGNAVIPLLEIHPRLAVVAVDFAKSAIELLSAHPFTEAGRLFPSVCDVVNNELPVEDGSLDVVLCMFVLSAIVPEVSKNAARTTSMVMNVCLRVLYRCLCRNKKW